MAATFPTEAFILLGLGLGIIGLRMYGRLTTVGIRGWKADDYLMLFAAVMYSIETYLAYTVGQFWHGLANNAMTDAERIALDPASEEYRLRVNGSKTQVAGWCIYTLLLWTVKACMCTFYLRFTEGLNKTIRIYIGFVLIVTTWIALLFAILFGCYPTRKNWQIYPDPGNYCQPAISRINVYVTVALNVTTDLYLLSIPLPLLWGSSLKTGTKAGLMLLFSGGIFVTMAAVLRCVFIIINPVTGAQQAGCWAVRETFVAIVTSNLPMVVPFLRRWLGPFVDSLRSITHPTTSRRGSPDLHRGHRDTGAFVFEDKNPRRGMGPRSVHPITTCTLGESSDAIVPAEKTTGGRTWSRDGGALPVPPVPALGGIKKETLVEVSRASDSEPGRAWPDYYVPR